mmetsp:Transcript_21269/g.61024  ORF Transcript_21269/g.61024 Transcript_21269/m.61024 type:complete len:209 (-) Transcript_21269:320-946(-)
MISGWTHRDGSYIPSSLVRLLAGKKALSGGEAEASSCLILTFVSASLKSSSSSSSDESITITFFFPGGPLHSSSEESSSVTGLEADPVPEGLLAPVLLLLLLLIGPLTLRSGTQVASTSVTWTESANTRCLLGRAPLRSASPSSSVVSPSGSSGNSLRQPSSGGISSISPSSCSSSFTLFKSSPSSSVALSSSESESRHETFTVLPLA